MKIKSKRLTNAAICEQWLAPYAKASSYTYQYSYEFLMEVLDNKSRQNLRFVDRY
jgi:hypothetical protein